jgi:rod shape determining protein RodA
MTTYLSLRDFDWPMFLIVLMICCVGVLQIYSATIGTQWDGYWWKQILYIASGVLLMWIVAQIDYHYLMGHVFSMYGVCVISLMGVLIFGRAAFGSTRWISLPGGLRFQVSEFAKLVIILLVARFMTELKSDVLTIRDLSRVAALVFVPAVLINIEPDLGTSLTYLPILGVGVFLAGMPWKYWAAIGVVFILVLPLGYKYALKDYQKERVKTFLGGEDQDPRGSGYQVNQSKIAIGSGGMWGKGVTKGTQTRLRFLPVPDKDFIFSAFAEEHGFVGVMLVLSFYLILLMQIVQNAQTAPDRAGMYICMGVAALVLFHILVNVGMVIGRMPVVGIPLPLMSYGGSSIWSSLMMLGLVNNVRLRRFVN